MYQLVLTNTCKSTYTSSERLTKREKIDMKMNMNQQLTFGMRKLLHEWLRKQCLSQKKNECVCVCIFMTKAHTYFTKIYLENKDFTFNSTVRQSMDGSLER